MAVLMAGAVSLAPAQDQPADLILANGRILTVDEKFSIAQAIAVRAGRIVHSSDAAALWANEAVKTQYLGVPKPVQADPRA